MGDHPTLTTPLENLEYHLHKIELRLDKERRDQDYTDSTQASFTTKVLSTLMGNMFQVALYWDL